MSGSKGVSITVRVVDRATAAINAINRRLAAMQLPARRLSQSLNRMYNLTGLTRLVNGMQKLGQYAFSAFTSVSRVAAAMVGLTGVATVAGLYKMISGWSQFSMQLGFAGHRLNMSAGDLQAWQGAGRLAGASADDLTNSMTTLNEKLLQASVGRDPQSILMFKSIFGDKNDALWMGKNAQQVFPVLIDYLRKIKNGAVQADAASATLGSNWQNLIGIIQEGSATFEHDIETWRKHGMITDEQAAKMKELYRAQTNLQGAVEGLKTSVTAFLSPVLVPYIDKLRIWVDANKDIVAANVARSVDDIGKSIESHDWVGAIKHFQEGVDTFGAWGKAAEIAGGLILARMLSPLIKMAAILVRFALIDIPGSVLSLFGVTVAGAAGPLTAAAYEMWPTAIGQDVNTKSLSVNDWRETHNPTNLKYTPGQPGALGPNAKGFGIYPDDPTGIAAGLDQMLKDQDRGYNTIRKELMRRSPPNENPTDQMIARVSSLTGWDPDQPYDLRNPQSALKFVAADILQEQKIKPKYADLLAGIEKGLSVENITGADYPKEGNNYGGPPLAGGQPRGVTPTQPTASPVDIAGGGAPPVQSNAPHGTANVNIKLAGFPLGTTTTATSSGDLFANSPPKIMQAMPLGGGP